MVDDVDDLGNTKALREQLNGNHSGSAVRLLEVELGAAVPAVAAFSESRCYEMARSLVRLHGYPLGVVDMPLGRNGISATNHAQAVWSALADQICSHLAEDGLEAPARLSATGLGWSPSPLCVQRRTALQERAPFATVAIPTRNRPAAVQRCVESLQALDYRHFEVVVVDNAPDGDETLEVIQQRCDVDDRIRYVRENRPGGSHARNRGLAEARGAIVAFVDDDVTVDRLWLIELVRHFVSADDVGCVTGMIQPAELETLPQVWAENYWHLDKGAVGRRYDGHGDHGPLHPYAAGRLGSGANMAFRTEVLRQIGGFDDTLGTSTESLGGEDLAAFFDVLSAGYALVYAPAAIVWHKHTRDYESLKRQAYGYGVGLTAYLTRIVVNDPHRLPDMISRGPRAVRHLLRRQAGHMPEARAFPAELKWIERRGLMRGPMSYLRSRRQRSASRD